MIDTLKEFQKRLGSRLKKYRSEANLTQEKLAELCDCSYQTISGVETGSSLPSFKILYKISEKLNVPMPVLFNFYYDEITRTSDELEVLSEYNKLDENKKKFILDMIKYMVNNKI